jgi:Ca2+/Na+ antiporter
MKQYNAILQWFWLAVAILTACYALLTYFSAEGVVEPLMIAMPIIALILFLLRFWYNRKINRPTENKDDQ